MNIAQSASIGIIELYQRTLSPRKGFVCAHNVLFGKGGCSGFGKTAIAREGVFGGLHALARRFRECSAAARVVRAFRMRPKATQRIRGWVAASALLLAAQTPAHASISQPLAAPNHTEYSDCDSAQRCTDSSFSVDGRDKQSAGLSAERCVIESAGNCVGEIGIAACFSMF